MIDPEITKFFDERKKANKRISSREDWLPDAARRADRIGVTTHPCTFSHPSSRSTPEGKVTSFIANNEYANDGYIRSGNIKTMPDALGDAATLDVYKFLHLVLKDGKQVKDHIKECTTEAKEFLCVQSTTFDELRTGLLAMFSENTNDVVTSEKIKQVYYPIDDTYHLLSIMTNSGILTELKNRLKDIRFNEARKEIKKAHDDNVYTKDTYKTVLDLTDIKYGGSKPQNVSVLNNKNGGLYSLLKSCPPNLNKWDVRFPRKMYLPKY